MDNLPVEILSDIVGAACESLDFNIKAQMLCNFCLVCQLFRIVCQPKLLADIPPAHTVAALQALWKHPHLAEHVKTLELLWLYPHSTLHSRDKTAEEWSTSQRKDVLSFWGICNNLSAIELDSRQRLEYSSIDLPNAGIAPVPAPFQHVTSFSFRCDTATSNPQMNGLSLLCLFPHLETLRISCSSYLSACCKDLIYLPVPGIRILLSRSLAKAQAAEEQHLDLSQEILHELVYTLGFTVDEVDLVRDVQTIALKKDAILLGSQKKSLYYISPAHASAHHLHLYPGRHDVKDTFAAFPNLFTLSLSRLPSNAGAINSIFTSLAKSQFAANLTRLSLIEYSWSLTDSWRILFGPSFPSLKRLDIEESLSISSLSSTSPDILVSSPTVIDLTKQRPGLMCYLALALRHPDLRKRMYVGRVKFAVHEGVVYQHGGFNHVEWYDNGLTGLERKCLVNTAKEKLGWLDVQQVTEYTAACTFGE